MTLKMLFILPTVVLLFAISVKARTLGFGGVVGDPTGLSAKLWISDTEAIDAAVAWSGDSSKSLHVHSDYLRHQEKFFFAGRRPLTLYFGAGGQIVNRTIKKKTETTVAARAPLGLTYEFHRHPIELFAELAATLSLVPNTEFAVAPGIGGRYYF